MVQAEILRFSILYLKFVFWKWVFVTKLRNKIATGRVAICIALLLFCPKPLEMTYYIRIRFWRTILYKAIVIQKFWVHDLLLSEKLLHIFMRNIKLITCYVRKEFENLSKTIKWHNIECIAYHSPERINFLERFLLKMQ